MQRTLKTVLSFCAILTVLLLMAMASFGQTRTSVANGNWAAGATWDCGCIPLPGENTVIAAGDTVTISANTTTTNLTINATGFLRNTSRLDVNGNYVNNGRHGGSASLRLRGTGTTISGTGINSSSGNMVLRDGNKTILVGTDMTKTGGNLRVNGGITVTNNGTMVVNRAITGNNAASTWTNAANSSVSVGRGMMSTGILNASAAGNTVRYFRNGTGNQTIKDPTTSTYYNLQVEGNNVNSDKRLSANTIISNDLTIAGSTFDASNSDFTINIAGNWTNTGGTFNPRDGSVTFDGSANQTITHSGTETFDNLTVANTDSVFLAGNIDLQGNLTITSTLDATAANSSISLQGNWSNTGTFVARSGVVLFDGSAAQTLAGTQTFYDLNLDNNVGSGGLAVTSGTQSVTHGIDIDDGEFDTNDAVTLISDASATASLFDLTGGSITGDITSQRYFSLSTDGWLQLTSPVTGTSLQDWKDSGIIMSGFTGSNFPAYSFNSAYTYDENAANGNKNDGYVAATNITNATGPSAAHQFYGAAANYYISVTGPAYTGTQSYTLDYQNITPAEVAAAAEEKGWNLIGNPYPCTIDWDNLAAGDRTKLVNAIWVWSAENGNYGTYAGGSGSGTLGVTNLIASHQGFWVHANAAAPTLTVNENDKSTSDAAFVKALDAEARLTLMLSGNANTYRDEAALRFADAATVGYDAQADLHKLYSPIDEAPGVAFVVDNNDITINALPTGSTEGSLPLKVTIGVGGQYALDFDGAEELGIPCLTLEDLQTQTMHNVMADGAYSFAMTMTDDPNRFVLHFAAAPEITVTNPACYGETGSIELANGPASRTFDVLYFDADGGLLDYHANVSTSDEYTDLSAGEYSVLIMDPTGACVNTNHELVIEGQTPMEIAVTSTDEQAGNDGSIELEISGGVAPYTVAWNTGATVEVLENIPAGAYLATVTDANGCEANASATIEPPVINAVQAPESGKGFDVWPNPGNGNFNVLLDEAGTWNLSIVDVAGKLVHSEQITTALSQVNTELLPGTYLVQLTNADEHRVVRLLVQ